MPSKSARLPWIFVDGSTQQSFRIRYEVPSWAPPSDGSEEEEVFCRFHITTDDGAAFSFQLQIDDEILADHEVDDGSSLRRLIEAKGVEIVEGAIHSGIRGNQQLVWNPDGVSVVQPSS